MLRNYYVRNLKIFVGELSIYFYFIDIIEELLKSVEQGEPTTLVQELLTELSSRVQLNLGPTLASQILGTSATSGMDLINKVLEDP